MAREEQHRWLNPASKPPKINGSLRAAADRAPPAARKIWRTHSPSQGELLRDATGGRRACLVRGEADEDHDGGEGEEPQDEFHRHGRRKALTTPREQARRAIDLRTLASPQPHALPLAGVPSGGGLDQPGGGTPRAPRSQWRCGRRRRERRRRVGMGRLAD